MTKAAEKRQRHTLPWHTYLPKMVAVPFRCGAESSVRKNWQPLVSALGYAFAIANNPRVEKRTASLTSLANVVPHTETLPLPVPVTSPP
mgnify:CR=1 FL=1